MSSKEPKKIRQTRQSHSRCIKIPEYIIEKRKENLQSRINKGTSVQEKYNILEQELRELQEKFTAKLNKTNKVGEEATKLLDTRKNLLTNKKLFRQEIVDISKQINESIRKHRKENRSKTILEHIKRKGGIRKAEKELKEKTNWIPNMRDKLGVPTTKRESILQIATDFYQDLYND